MNILANNHLNVIFKFSTIGCLAIVLGLSTAFAAVTDISNSPITSTTSDALKPNIMLLMDTSRSMARTHMPDEVEDNLGHLSVGYKSVQCNALYYTSDPAQSYPIPKKADKSPFDTPDFSAALFNIFPGSMVVKNLNSEFQAYTSSQDGLQTLFKDFYYDSINYTNRDIPQAAYYNVYSGPETLKFGSAPCTDPDFPANTAHNTTKSTTGGGNWTRKIVSATSGPGATDERQKFARWYTFYRTRINMIKSTVSLAFSDLTLGYRVGLIAVSPGDLSVAVNKNAYFVAPEVFNPAQRNIWYEKLFSQEPHGSSPTREGLARVGRYYAGITSGINAGMTPDPIEYSCQQNFTILTTDGYWNTASENKTYGGPRDIAGNLIPPANPDGVLTAQTGKVPRPIWEGGTQTATVNSKFYSYEACPSWSITQTVQNLANTSQNLANTSQNWQATQQWLASTVQKQTATQQWFKNTTQNIADTKQYYADRRQNRQQTQQIRRQTQQIRRQTQQNYQQTSQVKRQTKQILRSITQSLATTKQYKQQLVQNKQQLVQKKQQLVQNKQQLIQNQRYTIQNLKVTTQNWQSTLQIKETKHQITRCDASDDSCSPVASCSAGGNISCPVTIHTEVYVPNGAYTNEAASPGNNFTSKTYTTINLTTNVAVVSCTASSGSSPNYIATTCPTPTVSAPTNVVSCTASLTSSPNVSCPTPITSATTNVVSCTENLTVSPNIKCNSIPAAVTNVVSCTQNLTVSPNVTCPAPVTATATDVVSCTQNLTVSPNVICPTPVTASATNVVSCTQNLTVSPNVTCPTPVTATATNVVSCTQNLTVSPNVTCPTPVTKNNVPVPSPCAVNLTVSPNITACAANDSLNVAVATCTASPPTSGNGYKTTTCPTPTLGPVTDVVSCTANSSSNPNITCPTPVLGTKTNVVTCTQNLTVSPNITCPTPTLGTATNVATCTPDLTVMPNIICPAPVMGTITNVATCTQNLTSSPNIICPAPLMGTITNVATCTQNLTSSPNIICPAPLDTLNVPVASCAVNLTTSPNIINCPTPVTTYNVPVASCTVNLTTSPNVINCPAPLTTGPAPVASCTPSGAPTAAPWIETKCTSTTSASTPTASCTQNLTSSPNVICPAAIVTNNIPVAICNSSGPNEGNQYTTTTCSSTTGASVKVATCTENLTISPNIICPAPTIALNVPVANCTVDLTSSPNITSCPAPVISTNVPVQACTVGLGLAPNYVNVTSCPAPIITESIPQASCAGIVGTAPNWVTTLCIPVPREKLVSTTTTTSTTSYLKDSSGGVGSTIGTPAVSVAPSADESACVITATADPLPSPNPVISLPPIVNPGGSVGSLADVAQYYYATDLRTATGDPKATNNVRVGATEGDVEGDQADWQHMTTFVVGLGVSGTLNYNKDYKKLATGDFADIRNPLVSKAWPLWPDTKKKALNNSVVVVDCGWDTNTFQFYDTSLGINSDQDPCYFDPRSIDDFWHTAVNGRGTYFSADSPKHVVGGIKKALKDIGAATAAGSAAGATTLTPVFGDNTIFVAGYKTSDWTGDVEAREIDLNTGEVKDLLWSAKLKLDTQTGNACDNRNIYLFKSGATNNLLPFTWETSTCDANKNPTGLLADQLTTTEKAIFGTTNTSKLSQYYEMTDGTLGTVDQQTPAKGKNLVNFLRGQRGMEGFEAGVTNKLYRNRPNVLGDIINSSPVYVKAPFASYQDSVTPDYFTFKSDNASRRPMVYVGANDGMLHAFYATNPNAGQEAWAVIPSPSLETLYQLADNNYSSSATHQYFVDGTPSIGDIYDGTNWKTILVGGLNLGGKAYYALDITDPSAPIGLWEFKSGATCYTGTPIATDCHLGYSFGAPLITKIDDGTTNGKWVVIVTSGYNNVSSPSAIAGDGKGYLYVLDATNGQILHKISTGEGSATNPSGLTHVTSFVDSAIQNNLALRVYGGDLLGNIWRFDINDKIAPTGREATLVGTTKDSSGVAQPITIKPRLAEINGKTMLFVGTGKLLGVSDLTNAQVQSVYGVIDPLEGSPVYSDLRASLAPLAMTQTGTPPNATRQVACTGDTNTCVPTNGWVLDLPDTGERVNVGMELSQGVLIFGSNVPGNDPCSFAGYSWLNYVDFKTGVNVGSSSSVATWHSDSLIVGLNTFVIKGVQKAIVTTSDTKKSTKDIPQGSSGSGAKRISWREIAK